MVSFKVLKELVINLSFGFAALNNSWMFLGAVSILDVFVVDYAAAVTIKRQEGALDKVKPLAANFTPDQSEELIIADLSAPISIKSCEHEPDIINGDVKFLLSDCLCKFINVYLA